MPLNPKPSLKTWLQNYNSLSVDFSNATWNTVGTHELFTITGAVRIQIVPVCQEDFTAGGAATIKFGSASNTAAFISATGYSLIDAGKMWVSATPGNVISTTAVLDKIVTEDIGYEISTAAISDGTMLFVYAWEPVSTNGNLVVGAGGAL